MCDLLPLAKHLHDLRSVVQFTRIIAGVGIGIFLSFLVQSSSTVLFLIIGMGSSGNIPFLIGVAVILGANIGTTFSGLVASLEYQNEVKRLAVAYFIVKFVGAMMSVLLFRSFLNFVNLLYFDQISQWSLPIKLAAVHTGFNIINVIIWTVLSPILFKITKVLVKEDWSDTKSWSSAAIINLLTQVPEQAFEELKIEWKIIREKTKGLEDEIFSVIDTGDWHGKNVNTFI